MKIRLKKTFAFLAADIIIIAATVLLAFLLRFDGTIPPEYRPYLPYYILISIGLTVPLLFWRRLYSFTWLFVSLNEIVELFKVMLLSTILFFGVYLVFQKYPIFLGFPRSIIILSNFLIFLFIGALRSAKRIVLLLFESDATRQGRKRALIIGTGERAEELLRTLQRRSNTYFPVGILDEDPEKHSTLLHGVRVYGGIKKLPEIAQRQRAESIIIALAEGDRDLMQRTMMFARKANIHDIKIIPTMVEVLSGKFALENLRSVQVEDLLGREVARIEDEEIRTFIKGKRILITGAAGSIGSELSRQISQFAPKTMYLLDQEESNLFNLMRLLEAEHPHLTIKPIIADVRNEKKISAVITTIRPHIIFHAAAYKHVPLMEVFPEEAIATNVFGTLYVAKAALQAEVEKFVLISTDKAVRPVSIMGKTKKLAEMIVHSLNGKGKTQFASVRFGNVLGSRGSVLPIFQEQLRRRLPLTITHPRMMRFFMTAPEACLLVLEAAAAGTGGEIFVLDMGKPVKIVDLARELIRLSGLKPDRDIPIIYTKPRAGERLFEDIFNSDEEMIATRFHKVFIAKNAYNLPSGFLKQVEALTRYTDDTKALGDELSKLVSL